MIVEVEQRHIDNGSPYIASKCPIALALKEQGYETVSVGAYRVMLRDATDVLNRWYDLPEEAKKFIMDFDAGEKVEAIKFNITKTKDWR